ncbi:hypothetical protein, partial [Escherichia coli]
TMIWQPEFTDKTLSRKTGAVQRFILKKYLMIKIIQLLFVINFLFCKNLTLYQFTAICLSVGYAQNNIILMGYIVELVTPYLNRLINEEPSYAIYKASDT